MQRCGLQQQALIDRHEKLTVVWDGDAAAARLAARGLSAPQLRYLTAVEEWGVRNMLTIPVAFPPEPVLSPEERGVRRTEVCAKHCFHVHFPKDSFRVHFMQFVPRVALPPFRRYHMESRRSCDRRRACIESLTHAHSVGLHACVSPRATRARPWAHASGGLANGPHALGRTAQHSTAQQR